MQTFPKLPSTSQRYDIERALNSSATSAGGLKSVVGPNRNNRAMWDRMRAAGLLTEVGYFVTPAGYNAVGRPAPGQAWGTWTVAWRPVRGTVFSRAVNWAGTWAEAKEMANSVGELLGDGYQVYYTSTAAEELRILELIKAGGVDAMRAEALGSIVVDSGKFVRIVDNGMLPAELLDREVENVVHAMRRADTAPGRTRTLADYRTLATHLREVMSADAWSSLADKAASADERFTASYLNQRWARQGEPAERVQESDRAMAVADLAAQDAINDARDGLARIKDAADAAALEAAGGWGQPDGMLDVGDLGQEAAAQGLTLDAAATTAAGEPVFAAPALVEPTDEDESVCSDGYPEHVEEVVHQDADGTQWICRRCGAEGYEPAEEEAAEVEYRDDRRPDDCRGCAYSPGPNTGVRVSTSSACPVHDPRSSAILGTTYSA